MTVDSVYKIIDVFKWDTHRRMDFCSVPPQKATVLEDNCMNYNFARLYISQLYVKVQGVQKNNQV